MIIISNLEGNPSSLEIQMNEQGEWIAIKELPNGKFISNKGLMIAAYKRAITANDDLTGPEKAALINRNVTNLP